MEFGKEKEYIELRQGFNKETKSMAMLNKVGYIKWLEHKLVKNLALFAVSQQRELLKAYTKWLDDKLRDSDELDELIEDYFSSL
tara:strand:- start:22 stop:273 length:252 start_codon:yes stop_codon:yes gene_type:complete